jgi:Zn-dependent protease with chaperone function
VRAMLSLLRAPEFRVLGCPVSEADQPALWTTVKDICRELQTAAPDNIVLGLEPSFYVTESELTHGNGRTEGRSLFISLTLSHVLTVPELRAIIGHEMAHFVGEDTVFSQQFFPVYRGTLVALSNLSRNAVHGSIAIAQLPAITFLAFFFESFVTSEKNLSRLRETEADAVGARIGGSTNLATALVKVHAYNEVWGNVVEGVKFNHEEFRQEANLARAFGTRVSALPADVLSKAGANHVFHPTDSHPTLEVRLRSLQCDLPTIIPQTTVPSDEQSAASLIQGVAALEEQQTTAVRQLVRPA